jgi:putative transposase
MRDGCSLNAACHEPEYANLPPSQIVPILLDKGIYHASPLSYYRVLKQASQLHYRGRSLAPKNVGKPTSAQSEQVVVMGYHLFSFSFKGQFYYLYRFEDIFSRKVVGYEVYEQECEVRSGSLLQRCMLREQCLNSELTAE